jgi:hypothetical protein
MLTPRQFITLSRVDHRVYVLGCLERRVTLYSQQVRALNLIYSLSVEGHVKDGGHIAIVGGGAAGVTAAAAAASRGWNVTLLEQGAYLLPLQDGSPRWVHPHVYEWPRPGSENPHADLPLLDWSAGPADNVRASIQRGFDELSAGSRIDLRLQTRDVQIGPAGQLSWKNGDGQFDAIILAVGFGLEPEHADFGASDMPFPVGSYWASDGVHQNPGASERKYLVSGSGDGGLIDLLRVRLHNFNLGDVTKRYIVGDCTELKRDLLDIEKRAERFPADQEEEAAKLVTEAYKTLLVPKELDDALHNDLRSDTETTLHTRTWWYLGRQSSVLNRFLVSRLVNARHAVAVMRGELHSVRYLKESRKFEVSIGHSHSRFDRVIVRHGPERPPLHGFLPEAKRQGLRTLVLEMDGTRDRLWPETFFPTSRTGPSRAARLRKDHLTRALMDEVRRAGLDWRVTDDAALVPVGALSGTTLPVRVLPAPLYEPERDEISKDGPSYDRREHAERSPHWLSGFRPGLALTFLRQNLERFADETKGPPQAAKIGFVEFDATATAGEHEQPSITVRPINHLVTWAFNQELASGRIEGAPTAEHVWQDCARAFMTGPAHHMPASSQLFVELALVTRDGFVPVMRKTPATSVYARRNGGHVWTCGPERGPNWSPTVVPSAVPGTATLSLDDTILKALESEIRLTFDAHRPRSTKPGDVYLQLNTKPIAHIKHLVVQGVHLNSALLGYCVLPLTKDDLYSHLLHVGEAGGLSFNDPSSPVRFLSLDDCSRTVTEERWSARWHGTALSRLELLAKYRDEVTESMRAFG